MTKHPDQLTHAAAWQGEELFEREDWLYQLSDQEIKEVVAG